MWRVETSSTCQIFILGEVHFAEANEANGGQVIVSQCEVSAYGDSGDPVTRTAPANLVLLSETQRRESDERMKNLSTFMDSDIAKYKMIEIMKFQN